MNQIATLFDRFETVQRLLFGLSVAAIWLAGTTCSSTFADKPNMIVILADDLGWADLACYGNLFNESPCIDRLAKQGVRWIQFYAGPVCSPTRANIQSGQNQARFGITQHIPGHRRPFAKLADPEVPRQLPLEVTTFAEHLASSGYKTGYFGKWHLGGTGFGPQDQGWQMVFEGQGNTVPAKMRGDAGTDRMAEMLTNKAVDFIEQHQDEPFLIQVSHYAVHIPLSTTHNLLTKYRDKSPADDYPSRPEYAGLLEELDTSVGRIVDTIDRLNLSDRTLIIFTSDNGGLETEQSGTITTSNKPLRCEKGTLYEGGIRVPMIARWPGIIPVGQTSHAVASTIDLYATFAEVATTALPNTQPNDGISLMPFFKQPTLQPKQRPLFWHLPHYHHSTPASAIRLGDYKLIEFFEDNHIELYNLKDDMSEANNIAAAHPDIAEQLLTSLHTWQHNVNARMPAPNPDYDPNRADELAKGNRQSKVRSKK